jgi:hypothetical protein
VNPRLKQPEGAMPLQERAQAITQAAYVPDHLAVATRLNNLAAILRTLRQSKRAELLEERGPLKERGLWTR